MGRKVEKIYRKTTESGIVVTLFDNTVIKNYGRHTSFVIFSTHKEAKKEFSKFRQGKSKL